MDNFINNNGSDMGSAVPNQGSPVPPQDAAGQPQLNNFQQPQHNTYQQPPMNGSPYVQGYGYAPQGVPPYQPPFQPPYGTGYYPVPPMNAVKRPAGKRDVIAAWVMGVVCFVMMDCLIWTGSLGLGFAAGAAALMAVVLWYMKSVWKRMGAYSASCVALFFAGCGSMLFNGDSGLKSLDLLCVFALYIVVLMDGMKLRAYPEGSLGSVSDFLYTAFSLSFGKIEHGWYGLTHREYENGKKGGKGIGKALLGLILALPLAALLGYLLSTADEAFSGLVKGIDLGRLPQRVLSLLLAAPVFLLSFSRIFSIRDAKREPKPTVRKGVDPIALSFFLAGISVVYVAYLFSQFAYFFNGFMGLLPTGYSVASYARRGFFELTAVSVINILIVIISTAMVNKKDGKLPAAVKLLSLFLCLFSLVLAATEISKMALYMSCFGLTRLRILTTVFTVFLAAVFIALIIHIFACRFPYLKTAVIVGAALMIAMNFIGVDRMVAGYNVWAYENHKLSTVDVQTITELGDGAVPSLLKLATETTQYKNQATSELYQRWKDLHEYADIYQYRIGEIEAYDFRGFNIESYNARRLLLENEDVFVKKK